MAMLPHRAGKAEFGKTLVSWKEIASFLDRAERTVKRWERERGLPVHRIPGGERGGVFAYPDELRAWLLGEQGKAAQSSAEEIKNNLAAESTSSPAQDQVLDSSVDQTFSGDKSDVSHAPGPPGSHRWVAWIVPPALIVVAAVTFFMATRLHPGAFAARDRDSQSARHAPETRAEELYLQGRYEWSLRTADSLRKSIDYYTQAIVQDPAYAQAYAGLAESYDLLPEYEGFDRDEAFSRAKAAADRAIELDPTLPAGHRAKAFAMFYGDWDSTGSDTEFKKALALAPNEVETHHWYATSLFSRREKSEALAQIDEAVRLSPTNPAIVADAAFLHVELHDNVDANIKILRELARTQPNLVKASRYLEGIDLGRKNYGLYLADLRQTVEISHNAEESELLAAVERGWAHGGEHGLLVAMRDVDLAALTSGANTAYDLAITYESLGQPKNALQYFNLALEKHDVRVSWTRKDSSLAELEKDPDYRALLQRIDERLHLIPSSSAHFAVATEIGRQSASSSVHQ
jgi:tetratricopeptide (TPR) repeat protein